MKAKIDEHWSKVNADVHPSPPQNPQRLWYFSAGGATPESGTAKVQASALQQLVMGVPLDRWMVDLFGKIPIVQMDDD